MNPSPAAGPAPSPRAASRRVPFRLRIALLSAAISGLVLIAFGIAAGLWLRHERLAALDREIRSLAYRHPGWMNNQANYERLASALEFIFGEERKGQLILAALDAEGSVRFRSAEWPADLDPATLDLNLPDVPGRAEATPTTTVPSTAARDRDPGVAGPGGGRGPGWGRRMASGADALFSKSPRFLTLRSATATWRLGILGNDRDRLVLGLDAAPLHAETVRFLAAFGLALPAALLLIGAGGWWVAGRAVRPLRRIADAAERVTARGLDQRVPPSDTDPEIERLVLVLNGMMDRLETSFRQATRFSADASHELKTPLAVMQGELEQALQSAAEGSRDQRTYASLLEETQRLKNITRSLLLLAQADSGQLPLSPSTWDLAAEIRNLIDDTRALAEAEELDIQLDADLPARAPVVADRVLLRAAVTNLVQNAIHYSPPGGRIRISLKPDAAGFQLAVANTGPAIPPEERSRIFDRFHRGADARARRREGLGLGLSLAREIMTAHRGTLILARSDAAETEFRLGLPTGG